MKLFKIAAITLASILVFSSCESIKDMVNVDVPYNLEAEVTVPATTAAGNVSIPNVNIPINIDQAIKDYTNESEIGEIQSVKIKELKLEIPEAYQHSEDNLTAISRVVLSLNSDVNQQWQEIVRQESNIPTPFQYDLPVNDAVNFKDYFQASNIAIKADVGVSRATENEIKVKMKLKVIINVSL